MKSLFESEVTRKKQGESLGDYLKGRFIFCAFFLIYFFVMYSCMRIYIYYYIHPMYTYI